MNVIIAGAGGHALAWKASIERHSGWQLSGIVDTDTEKLEKIPRLWGLPEENAYPTITDAVRWSEDPVDLVIIATPIPTHHGLAVEALEQGLHVLLEKNMASTIEQGQHLVRMARALPRQCTAMGTQYRFRPTWWSLQQLFASPGCPIGPVSHLRFRSSSFGGDQRGGWRHFLPDIFAEDMMVHHVDVLRYVLGMNVVKVHASMFRPRDSRWLGTSTVQASFTFARPGKEHEKDEWVHAQYHGDWQGRGLVADWEDVAEFFGSRGSIRFEPPPESPESSPRLPDPWARVDGIPLIGEPAGSTIVARVVEGSGGRAKAVTIERRRDVGGQDHGHIDQGYLLEDMRLAIDSGGKRQPATCFEEGFRSFVVTRAAIESSKTGNEIWVPSYWVDPLLPPAGGAPVS